MRGRTKLMNLIKTPQEALSPMIPAVLTEGGLKREVKRNLGGPTITYTPEPRRRPSRVLVHEMDFASVDPAILEVRSQVARMAEVDLPVLMIGGDTIVRDAVARLVHKLSPRRKHGFVQVNCDATAAGKLERKLFGSELETSHGRGAAPMGIFEACNGGTVFLDGITSLPQRLQARLLDLVDEHRLRRTEGCAWVHVDVRIVGSIRMGIDEALASGKLRDDLFRRLESLTLHLPCLEKGGLETPQPIRLSPAKIRANAVVRHGHLRVRLEHSSPSLMSPGGEN
jgi:DNA-binding NtrC family response regulator